jgi:hypothetical protein
VPEIAPKRCAMAPQKFASVRYNKARPSTRIAPFRDDSSLVALRYEETKQAELPIPLPPPRNPLRTARPHSAAVPFTTSAIVVVAPALPPPQEEHPLFRSQSTGRPASDEWKRDSGLAPTASSVTIRPEFDDEMAFDKISGEFGEAPTVYREADPAPQVQMQAQAPSTPPRSSPGLFTIALRSATPETPPESRAEPSSPSTPTRQESFTRKLGKAMSIKSTGTKRLRKKSMSEDRVTNAEAPPAMPPAPAESWGSLKSLNSSKSTPRQMAKDDLHSVSSLPADNSSSFVPITTQIPADSFFDDLNALSFSKRGSVMFGGRRAINKNASLAPSPLPRPSEQTSIMATAMTSDAKTDGAPTSAPVSMAASASEPAPVAMPVSVPSPKPGQRIMPLVNPPRKTIPADTIDEKSPRPSVSPEDSPKPLSPPRIRVLPVDTERESQKVRSLYESGEGLNWQDGGRSPALGERLEPTEVVPSEEEENAVYGFP